MSKNIEKNQTPDMYNIVEVNTVPGIHMHMKPSEGKPRNVAKYMVDMIFPETKEQKNEQNLIYQKNPKTIMKKTTYMNYLV